MTPVRATSFGLPLARLALRRVAVRPDRPPVFALFERMAEHSREALVRRERPSPPPAC